MKGEGVNIGVEKGIYVILFYFREMGRKVEREGKRH